MEFCLKHIGIIKIKNLRKIVINIAHIYFLGLLTITFIIFGAFYILHYTDSVPTPKLETDNNFDTKTDIISRTKNEEIDSETKDQVVNTTILNLSTSSTTHSSTLTSTINTEKETPNVEIKNMFDSIYKFFLWSTDGDGSGTGSTVNYTVMTRNILYYVIEKYNIKSMIDAPCGSFLWMELLMQNISEKYVDFKYHGIDVVESVIAKSTEKFIQTRPNWKFSVVDFTSQSLPANYDLIFSRDALQHLSFARVINALERFANTPNAKYLLVGSYPNVNKTNENISDGSTFLINLTKSPFYLDKYVEVFKETREDDTTGWKHLILYDIQKHLKPINFTAMRSAIST